ncbi:MAG TPA: T9SS type A sorting domain-containing protein [Flavipsychrobacter sp.]|nr:T9SS type A sorting domain-containing protein [Flavipsychrobacter sp.]
MRQKFIYSLLFLTLLTIGQQSIAQSLLLHEGFDTVSSTASVLPTGWVDNILVSGAYRGSTSGGWVDETNDLGSEPSATPYAGNGMVIVDDYNINSAPPVSDIELVSPKMNLPSTGVNVVSFWVYISKISDCCFGITNHDSMSVFISSTTAASGGTELGHKIMIDSSNRIRSGWYQIIDTIPSTISGNNYLIFEANAVEATIQYNLDEVLVANYASCSGMPTAGYIGGPNNICANTPFILTDTSLTYYTGMSYQWQNRATGTTSWSDISGANSNSYQEFGITSPTDYRVVATCDASGLSDTSNPISVTINPFYICYCNTSLYAAGDAPPPTIDSVSINPGTLHHASHTTLPPPNNYASYSPTGSATTILKRGSVYTLYVKYGGGSGYGMGWIDYDHSGTFDGFTTPDEFLSLNSCCSPASDGSVTFTIPVDADTGITGFRVRNSSGYYVDPFEACDEFFDPGETEDFIVNIQPAPGHDLGCTAIIYPANDTTACANTNIGITAVIYNMGANADSNFSIFATYSGASSGSVYVEQYAPIQPFSYDTVYLGTIAPPLGGAYKINVYPVLATDSFHANDTSSITINLNPAPDVPIVISDTVCSGNNATVSVTPVSGVAYNWYSDDTGSTLVFSGTTLSIASLTSDTTFYVLAQNPTTGCVSSLVPLTAAIGASPIVNLGTGGTVCESPTLMLDAGNPGAKYLWSTGETTEKIHIDASGTYSVTVTKYCTATGSVTYTVNPLPSSNGINYDRVENTYYFSAAGVENALSYLWIFGDGDTSTLETPVHTYPTDSSYHVMLVLSNACGTDTVKWGVPTSVNSINQSNSPIKLYPNPANTSITISADNNVEFKDIVILNSVGAVVYRENSAAFKTKNIDISTLPSGAYIMKVNTSNGYFNRLFEVIHN